MKTGWRTRYACILLMALMPVLPGFAQFWLEVKHLNDSKRLIKSPAIFRVVTHEMIGIEFVGHYENESDDVVQTCWLRRTNVNVKLPDYIEGWTDREQLLRPGEATTLSNIVYIRPTSTGWDSLYIEAAVRQGQYPRDPIKANRFKIYFSVSNTSFDTPKIIIEPEYTRGLSNTISWLPADGSLGQDVYYFDKANPIELKRSVQKLYRPVLSDTLKTIFEGLIHQHQYGYFVKAVYETADGPLYLHSDIVYSTQDNVQPQTVISPQVLIATNGDAVVSWKTVTDALSSIKSYNIFRAVDTSSEVLLDSILVGTSQPTVLSWRDPTVVEGYTYYYRVRAVDQAGNHGDGERSNGISIPGVTDNPPVDELPDESEDIGPDSTKYISSSVDSLWFTLNGREEAIRFQVARDSIDYFSDPPELNFRFFDSEWVTGETLQNMGWVDPADPQKVFYVYDYTRFGNLKVPVNFVNGHQYIRRVVRQYFSTTDTTYLETVVPDCFPPDDIHNLRLDVVIGDPNFNKPAEGYQSWYFKLQWDPAFDAVSGLKRYHVYRQIAGIDTEYVELFLDDNYRTPFLLDTLLDEMVDSVANPLVSYRVTSEDHIGHCRSLQSTTWEVQDRGLGAPNVSFADITSPEIFLAHPDTLLTKAESITLIISRFDPTDVLAYLVSVNGDEQVFANSGQDSLDVQLSNDEVSQIKVRGLYLGKRSSIWSRTKVVIQAVNSAPNAFYAQNNPASWDGDNFLHWYRSSMDVEGYEIWRWNESQDSTLIGVIYSKATVIYWTDFYGIDELTGETGDTLVAYERYTYRVRAFNIFGQVSPFSIAHSPYCNRPPLIHDQDPPIVESGKFALTIRWQRPQPNLVSEGYKTTVIVMQDNLYTPVDTAYVVDKTKFTYHGALSGHNYIFKLQEVPNAYLYRKSAWSKPFTVSSLVSLEPFTVLSQPQGHIFVEWNSPEIIQKFKVDSFMVCRDEQCWIVPPTVVSYMDSVENLQHGQSYTYGVYGLDSLNQVVAANMKDATCDTGSVFIPEILSFPTRYLNNDSLQVYWEWRSITGEIDPSTRGAVECIIQASVSKTFPDDETQTSTDGPFPADSLLRQRRIKTPPLLDSENSILYFRIIGLDGWGHPSPRLWSTDFYPMKSVVYDTVHPLPVRNLDITSSTAFYGAGDSLLVQLSWTDSSLINNTELRANVATYTLIRSVDSVERIKQVQNVLPGQSTYMLLDSIPNQITRWRVVSVDSAGNQVTGSWVELPLHVSTPNSPIPTGFRSCYFEIQQGDTADHFVEIAMNPSHFVLAYEIDSPNFSNRMLCQSGWISDSTFTCITGWGAIVTDTTWFRLKRRHILEGQSWESGWSEIVFFTNDTDGDTEKPTGIQDEVMPKEFEVRPNYPNPFNAQTVIAYQLPKSSDISIRIYSIVGRKICTLLHEHQSIGRYTATWDGKDDMGVDVATGLYIAQVVMKADDGELFNRRLKMTILK